MSVFLLSHTPSRQSVFVWTAGHAAAFGKVGRQRNIMNTRRSSGDIVAASKKGVNYGSHVSYTYVYVNIHHICRPEYGNT